MPGKRGGTPEGERLKENEEGGGISWSALEIHPQPRSVHMENGVKSSATKIHPKCGGGSQAQCVFKSVACSRHPVDGQEKVPIRVVDY